MGSAHKRGHPRERGEGRGRLGGSGGSAAICAEWPMPRSNVLEKKVRPKVHY